MRGTNYPHLHPFIAEEDHFVLNIHTSQLYKVDRLMYEILTGELSQQYPAADLISHRQYLEEFEGLTRCPSPGERFSPQIEPVYSTLDLQVAHTCNLNCKYCYAQGGNFGGEDRQMTIETARRALDFFFEHASGEGPFQIGYDGGEPLSNFEVIRDSSLYAVELGKKRKQKVNFTIGTNATLVTDEIAGHFEALNFSPQISLDGHKPVHDELRPFRDGRGSYDALLQGIDTFTRNSVKLASRITVTPKNLNLKGQVEQLYRLGAIRIAAFPASGVPGDYTFTEENLGILKEEYKKTADYILDMLFNKGEVVRFANLTEAIDVIHNAQIKHYGCGAGRGFFSVNPEGNLYPCHRLVGNSDFLLGTLDRGFNTEKTAEILQNHVDSRETCSTCWARYLCGGGCMAESHFAHRDIKTPFVVSCEIYKFEMETTCWMYSKILEHDKTLLDKFCT
jgi:uncharacterized protein